MSLLHPLSPSSPHSGLPGINIASYNSPLTKSMSNTPLSSAKSSYSIASDFFVSPPTQGSREKRKGND